MTTVSTVSAPALPPCVIGLAPGADLLHDPSGIDVHRRVIGFART
jgi:hypothetical protein